MKRLARTDIAIQTRQLIQQAVWCGVVTGLATTLLMLNLMPPVGISYSVSGKVLTSATRAESLRDAVGTKVDGVSQPTIRAVRILDRSSESLSSDASPQAVLLGVESIWHQRCDQEQFRGWIESLTANNARTTFVDSNPIASELRMVQWQLDAAKHYLNHQEYVRADSKTSSGVFHLASTGAEPSAQQLKQQMLRRVQELESKLAALQKASNDHQPSGKPVELTDDPVLQPRSGMMPAWMAMSVLVLGLAVGSCAGWLQLRLHSGGVFDSKEVAEQLASVGIPNVASVQISADADESADWISLACQKASHASRKGGRNLTLLSETVLAIWCVVILARLVFDPLWRGLLIDSPLAALARLFGGMP